MITVLQLDWAEDIVIPAATMTIASKTFILFAAIENPILVHLCNTNGVMVFRGDACLYFYKQKYMREWKVGSPNFSLQCQMFSQAPAFVTLLVFLT